MLWNRGHICGFSMSYFSEAAINLSACVYMTQTHPSREVTSIRSLFVLFVMHKTNNVRMAKVKCATAESDGPRSGRLVWCCALSGPPLDHRSISSSVSASTGRRHLIADLIFQQRYRNITNKPFTGRSPRRCALLMAYCEYLACQFVCFVPAWCVRVGVCVRVYEPIFYTLVIFFEHQSHGSFCSSLNAWGLIQRSSETCKLSISHCKVCKLPPPPSASPLVHYSGAHPSEWKTPPLFSGRSGRLSGERRAHNYTSALCFWVSTLTSQTGLSELIWTAFLSLGELECSSTAPLLFHSTVLLSAVGLSEQMYTAVKKPFGSGPSHPSQSLSIGKKNHSDGFFNISIVSSRQQWDYTERIWRSL